jgi:hypothetical protein
MTDKQNEALVVAATALVKNVAEKRLEYSVCDRLFAC